ncbi:hypothetical protein PG985_010293 [Apiospora marii]|uniref:Uncharacterized protein n=1 Tax=Apiospora marii TaxID=335849 RepID=A0ABR1RLH4_9PEZI
MAPLPQQANGYDGLLEPLHQRRLHPLLRREDEAFTPDAQFVLSISVITIAFVMFVGVSCSMPAQGGLQI